MTDYMTNGSMYAEGLVLGPGAKYGIAFPPDGSFKVVALPFGSSVEAISVAATTGAVTYAVGATYTTGNLTLTTGNVNLTAGSVNVTAGNVNLLSATGGIYMGASSDLVLSRNAAATLQLGATDAAAPVAQSLVVQSVVAGTSNTAGTDFTISGSKGTGTGAGGAILFKSAVAGSSGTAQNALTTRLQIGTQGSVVVGSGAALASNATTGFFYVQSVSNTPSGTPTSFTGSTAFAYDTTNNRLWAFNSSWRSVAVA